MKRRRKKPVRFYHGLITVLFVIGIVFWGIVQCGASPQVPLVLGCLAAGGMAFYLGNSWEEILEGMLTGIADSLEAILILLLIGMLVAGWIAAGTVPTMICYGLKLMRASIFLPATMLICLMIAAAIGSWGTVGTMGLAFMGIGLALKVPAPMTAGAVISGAYMGEVISPLSDATNLAAGVTGAQVFGIVRRILPAALAAGALALVWYAALGLRYGAGGAGEIKSSIAPLLEGLGSRFVIAPPALLPLAVILLCIALHVPAIPSMLAGALAGMACARGLQGEHMRDILAYACDGFVSRTGNETLDVLLSAGGLQSMLEPVSVILIAMAFGGIMKASGQMEALVAPLAKRVRSRGKMVPVIVLSCIGMNALLPDQYLGISMPGQMYGSAGERAGLSKAELAAVLLGGGAVTSPLIPWNTCGIYCMSILGVRPAAYLPYAVYGILLPAVITAGFCRQRKHEQ